jgi:trehalose 6-phosphate phosphatase
VSAPLPAGLAGALAGLARRGALLAFDFDGTLAPLVPDPAAAALPPPTRARLARLATRRPCAVLSGRALDDLDARLAGLPLVARVGNHGLEADGGPGAAGVTGLVGAWRAALEARLRGEPGVTVEDKRLSLSVHYRAAPDAGRAARAIRVAVAGLPGARVFGGHAVVNVVPAAGPHKGDALRTLLAGRTPREALYVGDDETDEDAFALADELPLLGVRVGPASATRASFVLPAQESLDALLDVLLEGAAG